MVDCSARATATAVRPPKIVRAIHDMAIVHARRIIVRTIYDVATVHAGTVVVTKALKVTKFSKS